MVKNKKQKTLGMENPNREFFNITNQNNAPTFICKNKAISEDRFFMTTGDI